MRRQDREDPSVTRARDDAQSRQLRALCLRQHDDYLADYRRAKAALPPGQYNAFTAATRAKRAEVLAGIELVGQTVSKRMRQIVADGIDKELKIIAGLRRDGGQQSTVFAEGDTANVFS